MRNRNYIETVESRQLFSAAPASPNLPRPAEPPALFMPQQVGTPPAFVANDWMNFPAPDGRAASQSDEIPSTTTDTPAAPVPTVATAAASPPAAATTGQATSVAPAAALQSNLLPTDNLPIGLITYASSTEVLPAPTPAVAAAAVPPIVQSVAASPAASWATAAAAAAANAGSIDALRADASLLDGSVVRRELAGWVAEFAHEVAKSPLPEIANAFTRDLAQGVVFVAAESQQLLAFSAVHRSEIIDGLAAVFAGGAFSAWWFGSREADESEESHAEHAAFCDDLIGFGRVRA